MLLVWAWMLWLSYAPGTCTLLWVGHECACHRMLSEHERYHGLGTDTNVLMVWEWMHLLSYALGTRTLLWLGHGCAIVCSRNTNVSMVWEWMRDSMLSEHERYYGVGMDALVIACSQNTNERYYGLGMDALAFAFALP